MVTSTSAGTGRLVESMRRFVGRACEHPVPHRLCSIPYHAAVRELGRRVAAVDGVRALVSRNSYADRTHRPGISDLDLVVVLEDDLGAPETSDVVHRCHEAATAVGRRYPMVDRPQIYTGRAFSLATAVCAMPLDSYAWRCEWGDEAVLAAALAPSEATDTERVVRAVQVYLNGFLDNLARAIACGRRRSSLAVDRSVRKIHRSLSNADPKVGSRGGRELVWLVANLLRELDQAVETLGGAEPPHRYTVVEDVCDSIVERLERDRSGLDLVSTVDDRHRWAIVPGSVERGVIEDRLRRSLAVAAHDRPARPLTSSMLRVMLREINPLFAYRLRAERRVYGEDPIPGIEAPTGAGIRRQLRFEGLQELRMPDWFGGGPGAVSRRLERSAARLDRLRGFIDHGEFRIHTAPRPVIPAAATPIEIALQSMRSTCDLLESGAERLLEPVDRTDEVSA